MERRKASPEQLNILLGFLEHDKELAIGKFSGLESKIRQTNAWIKITEKLNATSGFGSGAIKTPRKWQQTWRDWKSNVKKKAFKIRKNRFTPSCNANTQLTGAEEKILRLICTNTSVFGLPEVPETCAIDKDQMVAQNQTINHNVCNSDPSASGIKWVESQTHPFSPTDIDLGLGGVNIEPDSAVGTSDISMNPDDKPLWKKGRQIRFAHDKLLSLEEERIKIEKQKLLEKKRCNNIRLKMEKDRLEIERHRNILLEKLLVAVEMVVHR